MEIKKTFESFITEASRRKVHKAAKDGSYPAVIVVVKDGKVIHQEPVSSPEVAPATFNVIQKEYPNALLHLEDKTGKRLFSESVVNEMDSEGIQSLADELNAEVYTARLKNGAKSATIKATTTTKTWDDGAPVLKYLARGKAQSMAFTLYQRPFTVLHDVAHGWFYFTDGRKWYGLYGDEGYSEPEDLPFDMEISESVVTEDVDMDDLENAKYRLKDQGVYKHLDIEYKQTRRSEKYVQIHYIPISRPQSQNPEWVNVRYDNAKDLNKISKELNMDLKESVVTESVFSFKTDNIEQLHFETDPKTAEEMKIELGKMQGEVSKRKQIESAEYSLRRFRKEIGYGNGKDVGVFLPGSYDASISKLGDGPHKKAVKAVKWNQKKYDQWVEDMASNGGAENAFDMAQNAKNETGLIDWVKKNFRGDDPLQRIQWDIEALAESYNEDDINMIYGFYGTVSDNSNEKNAKKLFDQGIKDLKKKYRLTEEEALEVLNSKMGRKAADQIYDGQAKTAVEGLETYYGKTLHKELAEIQKSMVFDSTVTEARVFTRAEVMDFLEKDLKFVRTSEEFDGVEGGIWTSAENGETMGSSLIFDYYSTSSKYEFGVLDKFAKKLSKMGWYCEYYDPGTVMIWPI